MGCSSYPLFARRGRGAEPPSVIDIQISQEPSSHSPNVFLFLSISVASPGFLSSSLRLVYITVDAGFAHGIFQGDLISVLIFTFSRCTPLQRRCLRSSQF